MALVSVSSESVLSCKYELLLARLRGVQPVDAHHRGVQLVDGERRVGVHLLDEDARAPA